MSCRRCNDTVSSLGEVLVAKESERKTSELERFVVVWTLRYGHLVASDVSVDHEQNFETLGCRRNDNQASSKETTTFVPGTFAAPSLLESRRDLSQ